MPEQLVPAAVSSIFSFRVPADLKESRPRATKSGLDAGLLLARCAPAPCGLRTRALTLLGDSAGVPSKVRTGETLRDSSVSCARHVLP